MAALRRSPPSWSFLEGSREDDGDPALRHRQGRASMLSGYSAEIRADRSRTRIDDPETKRAGIEQVKQHRGQRESSRTPGVDPAQRLPVCVMPEQRSRTDHRRSGAGPRTSRPGNSQSRRHQQRACEHRGHRHRLFVKPKKENAHPTSPASIGVHWSGIRNHHRVGNSRARQWHHVREHTADARPQGLRFVGVLLARCVACPGQEWTIPEVLLPACRG